MKSFVLLLYLVSAICLAFLSIPANAFTTARTWSPASATMAMSHPCAVAPRRAPPSLPRSRQCRREAKSTASNGQQLAYLYFEDEP
jgi:hypothetical protein